MAVLRKQESPTDRIRPACSGFSHELEARWPGSTPNYLGGDAPGAGAIVELLVPSAGAIVELLVPSVVGAGVVRQQAVPAQQPGEVVPVMLLQAVSTSAAARALARASFVFIDESPEMYESKRTETVECKTLTSGFNDTPEARIL